MLKSLSKDQLLNRFFQEIEREKITITNVVNYIREIDSRRLYLDLQCTSLFQFLTEKAKYSKSAAQRRIDAARLIQQLPQLENDLKSGEINLTQTSQISRLVREKEKSGKLDPEVKANLVEAVKNKSTDETEMILCQMLMSHKNPNASFTDLVMEMANAQMDRLAVQDFNWKLIILFPCIKAGQMIHKTCSSYVINTIARSIEEVRKREAPEGCRHAR